MTCVNLRERYGDVYRVEYEESYQADRGDGARAEDRWLMTIPCENGHIFVCGGDRLGASSNLRGTVAKKLMALDCTTVVQDGDDGVNVTFHVDHFEAVAKAMKPRKRRRLSPEQRQASVERLAKYKFKPAAQRSVSDQITHPAEVGGPEGAEAGPSGLEVAKTTA